MIEIGDRILKLEFGKIGNLASSTVIASYGDTVVLVSALWKKAEEKKDFLPLLVEYREGAYAAGKIPAGFIKREGRATDREIIIGRAIDRSIRPLFPKGMIDDVEIIALLLSYDNENPPYVPAIIGASFALCSSEIPFEGPVGAVRIGYVDNKFVVNPTISQKSEFDLLIVGTKGGYIHMIEFGGKEIEENLLLSAIEFAIPYIEKTIEYQEELLQTFSKPKSEPTIIKASDEIYNEVLLFSEQIKSALYIPSKGERNLALENLYKEITQKLIEKFPNSEIEIADALYRISAQIMRNEILNNNIRVDGRKLNDIRPISCEVGILPRTHGSALFTRGETQALVIATLGTRRDAQILSELEEEEFKRFMVHYNFHPFSTNEVRPLRGPSRREIGHGALAEKALSYVIPDEDKFPYTIRLVSEITQSNGSTSMATVCGGTLALMDAGVPISSMVAGISIGLVLENYDKYALLTDIVGMEDHFGDMDFKIAGTRKGITAIQLDIKIKGLNVKIIKEAFSRAREAREYILDIMSKTISEPRKEVSKYAPKILVMNIPMEKIGDVIGPGGKVIRKIINTTNTKVEIDFDTGKTLISGLDYENVKKAKEMISEIIQEVEVGKVYLGKITRIENYGLFVEILPGKIGLVHISEVDEVPIKDLRNMFKVGDEVLVKVIEIDELGRPKLSRKQALNE
ncbi:MAG: polyribonucleotide nucleotidyltransferase [candidate division WOR-3 bacterium]